jgi:hypothetical protein
MISMRELSKRLDATGVPHTFVSASDTPDGYEEKLKKFVAGVKEIIEAYGRQQNFKSLMNVNIKINEGKVYDKITSTEDGDSANKIYCFINRSNGDILKPATFKVPARGPRGNLFDGSNGLKRMGPYGPAYNK